MRNDIVEGSRGLEYVCLCVRKGHQENSTTQIARQTFVSRDTRQVDADSGGVIEARQTDNGGSYLIFVIFFTRAKFFDNKIYTEKRQLFALNL